MFDACHVLDNKEWDINISRCIFISLWHNIFTFKTILFDTVVIYRVKKKNYIYFFKYYTINTK